MVRGSIEASCSDDIALLFYEMTMGILYINIVSFREADVVRPSKYIQPELPGSFSLLRIELLKQILIVFSIEFGVRVARA